MRSVHPARATLSTLLAIGLLAAGPACTQSSPEATRSKSVPPAFRRPSAISSPRDRASAALDALPALAFASDREGQGYRLYSMDPKGGSPIKLTNARSVQIHPSWSPNGAELAFAGTVNDRQLPDYDLFVIDPRGRTAQLTAGPTRDGAPSWSPDGKEIVFESERRGSVRLMLVSANGGEPATLLAGSDPLRQPDWSPDGERIAFARGDSDCTLPEDRCDRHVYSMSSNGTNIRQLTTGAVHESQPIWSPDGSKLLFTSNRGGDDDDLWTVDADGEHLRRLTDSPGADFAGIWSPDGSQIAFTSARDGDYEIYVMNADGSSQANLTNSPGSGEVTPTWRSS